MYGVYILHAIKLTLFGHGLSVSESPPPLPDFCLSCLIFLFVVCLSKRLELIPMYLVPVTRLCTQEMCKICFVHEYITGSHAQLLLFQSGKFVA